MKLSKRLQAVAQLVPPGSICADIGSDHGYLPIYLVKNEICPKAICADVAKGPLKSAERNIAAVNLTEEISLRLGNGLTVLKEGEASCVTICGMGAGLMCEILDNSPSIVKSVDSFIFAPNVAPEILRKWAYEHHWQITDEELIEEDDHFYPIIVLKSGEMAPLSTAELFAGPILLKKKHPLLGEYLRHLRQKEMELTDKLLKVGQANTIERAAYLQDKWRKIEEAYLWQYKSAL